VKKIPEERRGRVTALGGVLQFGKEAFPGVVRKEGDYIIRKGLF